MTPSAELHGSALSAIVLGASGVDRMLSARPKALQMVSGRPLVQYVIDALDDVAIDRIVLVLDHASDQVAKQLTDLGADPRLVMVERRQPGGTADVVGSGLEPFRDEFDDDDLIVLPGNTPLLSPASIRQLVEHHKESGVALTLLTVDAADAPQCHRIIEARDASPARLAGPDAIESRGAASASTGVYCVRRSLLMPALRRIVPDSSTGQSELADVVEVLADAGHRIGTIPIIDAQEASWVDDRIQLAEAEASIRLRTNLHWMTRGVAMIDPARTYIDATVILAPDITLYPGTLLQGSTVIGGGATIGPDSQLVDCAVGSGATVTKTVAADAEIGPDAVVGPFAVLEPGSAVGSAVTTGPFYHATR